MTEMSLKLQIFTLKPKQRINLIQISGHLSPHPVTILNPTTSDHSSWLLLYPLLKSSALISISCWLLIITQPVCDFIYDISPPKSTKNNESVRQSSNVSQEQGLHATCETKVVYQSNPLPAELSVQSGQGRGASQAVSQLLTESFGSFRTHTSSTVSDKTNNINCIGFIFFK